MNSLTATALRCLPLVLLAQVVHAAPPFEFATFPLFLAPPIRPNVMIVFDNSQSMDATMAGKVISGDDPSTRGNISRSVLRNVLNTYRDSFNWGLTTFETTGNTLYNTHAYYLGDATTMVYTNDCVAGVSASNGGRRCIANPDAAANGFSHITYARTGDDPDINDVLYSFSNANAMYGVGDFGTNYFVNGSPRDATTDWRVANFPVPGPFGAGSVPFAPTDAGFLAQAATAPRQLWIKRGWGYGDPITGAGKIVAPVRPDSDAHFLGVLGLLANESNGASGEIKNSAFFTPLAGSLKTVRDYFANGATTPITQTCQRSYIMLATDGNPTGKLNGTQYNPSEWVNTFNAATGTWTWGQAQRDVLDQLTGLRATPLAGQNYDIRSYVIGMGDTLANASSVAALNNMAVLGGGFPLAFTGSDATTLSNAFQSIIADIQKKSSAASSVALNSGSHTADSKLFQAKFDSTDWSGDLLAFAVNGDGSVNTTAAWSAGAALKAQAQVPPTGWDTQRAILTYKPSNARGISFRWPANPAAPGPNELDVTQTTALNLNALGAPDGFGEARLRFLRGDASREARNCNPLTCAAPQFRNRSVTPLGDIVNSAPFYVGAPNAAYFDDFEPAPYSAFKAAHRTRRPVIYAGANDGMLHAFNAQTGAELFAYVPGALYGGLSQLTNLNYTHRYYADAPPVVGDVFYTGAWHSLLVAGLRTGGKGLFALDVTDPASFSEAGAANIVRWEFQDADMGHVFAQPSLLKTNNGRWSVIVGNGYNSGSATGRAALFVIDAETGALVRKIEAPSGSAASPNGLSAPAAIDVDGDGIADTVYAGDLNGNLWKFDLSGTTAASWGLGNAAAPLFTAAANQPIVGQPNVMRFPRGGFMITFGTGQYMSTGDNGNTFRQALYGIWDNLSNGTVTLAQLQEQSIAGTTTVGANTFRISTHAVDPAADAAIAGDNTISRANYYANKRGWFLNLPTGGERVVVDSLIRSGRVIYTSLIPDISDPCAFGGNGWVLEFDAITGNRFDTGTFDTNGDGIIDAADRITQGDGRVVVSGVAVGSMPSGVAVMERRRRPEDPPPPSCVEVKYLNTSEGLLKTYAEACGKGGSARVMWREVQ